MGTRTSPTLGEGYVKWRQLHCILWPALVASVAVSWGLSRASVADLQHSIDRVLATQQILLEKALE